MSETQPTCATCRFGFMPPSGFSLCKRFPPPFPFADRAGWCGEWAAKAEAKPAYQPLNRVAIESVLHAIAYRHGRTLPSSAFAEVADALMVSDRMGELR